MINNLQTVKECPVCNGWRSTTVAECPYCKDLADKDLCPLERLAAKFERQGKFCRSCADTPGAPSHWHILAALFESNEQICRAIAAALPTPALPPAGDER